MDIVKRIRTNPAVIAYAIYTGILILGVSICLHQNLYSNYQKIPRIYMEMDTNTQNMQTSSK
jgi:hypothetical protein